MNVVGGAAPPPPAPAIPSNDELMLLVVGGCLLSLNAGFVNAVALQGFHHKVTHVSGALTNLGQAIVQTNEDILAYVFPLVVLFYGGCVVTGLCRQASFGSTRARSFICVVLDGFRSYPLLFTSACR